VHGGADAVVERETFDGFWRRDHVGVVAFAYALTGSRTAAEDLAQDAFAAAASAWATIENPSAWVRRVVANRSVSRWRRRDAEARALSRWAGARRGDSYEMHPDDAEFWDAVRRLPRRQAQVVALHYLDDLPVAAIAEVLDIAEGTVKATLHGARAALARALRCEDDEEAAT
jgi:RNA polymerase sigma-70 factor (ECF subfamily)